MSVIILAFAGKIASVSICLAVMSVSVWKVIMEPQNALVRRPMTARRELMTFETSLSRTNYLL